MNLNHLVDCVYVINLDRRTDRLAKVSKEFERIETKWTRWSAFDGKTIESHPIKNLQCPFNGTIGCHRSHRAVLSDAIQNGYERIAVFEDDIEFCKDFNHRLEPIPDDADVLYFGCNYQHKLISGVVQRCWNAQGMFAFVINRKAMDLLLRASKYEKKPIDRELGFLTRNQLNAYTYYPFLVRLDPGWSDIGENEVEYTCVNDHFVDRQS